MSSFLKFLGAATVAAGAAFVAYKIYDKKYVKNIFEQNGCGDDFNDTFMDFTEKNDDGLTAEPAQETLDDYLTEEEIVSAEGENEQPVDELF